LVVLFEGFLVPVFLDGGLIKLELSVIGVLLFQQKFNFISCFFFRVRDNLLEEVVGLLMDFLDEQGFGISFLL